MTNSRYHQRRDKFLEDPEIRAAYDKTMAGAWDRLADQCRDLFVAISTPLHATCNMFSNLFPNKEQPNTMSSDDLKRALDSYKYDPFKYSGVGPFRYCQDGDFILGGLTTYFPKPKPEKVYRIRRDTGEIELTEPMGLGGVYIELFNTYVSGSYKTEEEARKAALEYTRKAADTLTKATQRHREWLRKQEDRNQQFQIGDKVGYVGNGALSVPYYVRGLICEVFAVRKDGDEGFRYQVAFPRHESSWIPQRDLALREKATQPTQPVQSAQPAQPKQEEAPTKQEEAPKPAAKGPIREAFDLIGKRARRKDDPNSYPFNTIISVKFREGCEPVFELSSRLGAFTRNQLFIAGLDDKQSTR